MRSRQLLREKLASGQAVGGLIQFVGHPLLNELMGVAGADFVVIDQEHSALDLDRTSQLILASDAAGVAPFIRVPGVDPAQIGKLLNMGAAGIVLPHANAQNCAALIRAMQYAPVGTRGACPMVRAKGFSRGGWDAYAAQEHRELMAIAMVEDKSTLDELDALLDLPGLTTIMIGATDLSISLGIAEATFDHPKMAAALDAIVAAARRRGKFVMCGIGKKLEIDAGRRMAERGVQLLVYGTDCDLYLHGLRRISAVKDKL
jgi:4-hydroxy-2-oxoheptanedioate aldolase